MEPFHKLLLCDTGEKRSDKPENLPLRNEVTVPRDFDLMLTG